MPDFTVIDGGGPPYDYEAEMAQNAFRTLVMEILRAVARGDDDGDRVRNALVRFSKYANEAKIPLREIIDSVLPALHREAFSDDPIEGKYSRIVRSSLRLAAESMAGDGFAAGRRSSRYTELSNMIEDCLIGEEKLSRTNGNWSYLGELLKSADRILGKWKPKKEQPAPRVRRPDDVVF